MKLPVFESHRDSFEKCVYCPKLCRAACPVSNTELTESVTPWGKMSMAYFAARGDVPLDHEHAELAWACTSCYSCRQMCDHRNEVGPTLVQARADFFANGAAPEPVMEWARAWESKAESNRQSVAQIRSEMETIGGADVALLLGCSYSKHLVDVSKDAIRIVERLTGKRPRLVQSCCGLGLRYAGDQVGFERAAHALKKEISSVRTFFVLDPGCFRTIHVDYAAMGIQLSPRLVLDLIYENAHKLQPVSISHQIVRYHDPCQLGRGLGYYEQPRKILQKLTGKMPAEFTWNRESGSCSGAGGLLPIARPKTSKEIGKMRTEEHESLGGGLIVSACAQSILQFKQTHDAVSDIVSLVATSLSV